MYHFRKKPVVINARRIDDKMTVNTPTGPVTGTPGDWLIKGVEGELYFTTDSVFRATYEAVDAEAEEHYRQVWLEPKVPQ